MTERPGQDTATDNPEHPGEVAPSNGAAAASGGDDASATEPESPPATSRTAARPSPTSRARRTAAAAAPDALRRPRPAPRPSPQPGPATGARQAAATTAAPAATDAAASSDGAGAPAEGAAGSGRTDEAPVSLEKAPGARTAGALDTRPASRPSAAEPGRRVPVWLIATLVVAVLALAALDGWLLTSQPGQGSRAEREQALSTAKSSVPLILSYDYQRFDSDVAAARARLTGRAVDDYAKAMATMIKPTATKEHAVVQAQTDGAGVEAVSGDGNQVTVVVFGEQKVTKTSLTAPRIDLFRVRVTLDRVQGQWLVSKFDQI